MTELAGRDQAFRHDALLYSGPAEFRAEVTSLVSQALAAGQPVLAVLPADKLALLRDAISAPEGLRCADMAQVGGNPARILGVWQDFAAGHAAADQIWGLCEPLYATRSVAEIAECQLYESLLSLAIGPQTPLALLCAYDRAALAAELIDTAERTHPFLSRRGSRRQSAAYQPFDPATTFARPLPPRPADAAALAFAVGGLRAVRTFAADHAGRADVPAGDRLSGLVAAVNEIATNSIQHGGGAGQIFAWADGGWLTFDVTDSGEFTSPMAGRQRPGTDTGAGLWLAHQLCDLVQIFSAPGGTAVRLHFRH